MGKTDRRALLYLLHLRSVSVSVSLLLLFVFSLTYLCPCISVHVCPFCVFPLLPQSLVSLLFLFLSLSLSLSLSPYVPTSISTCAVLCSGGPLFRVCCVASSNRMPTCHYAVRQPPSLFVGCLVLESPDIFLFLGCGWCVFLFRCRVTRRVCRALSPASSGCG